MKSYTIRSFSTTGDYTMSLTIHTNLNNKFIDPDPYLYADRGVKKQNHKSQKIIINGEEIILKDTEMINPFFVGMDGGSVLTLEPREMRCYKEVYMMCHKDDVINTDLAGIMMKMFSRIIDKEILQEICKKFTLIRTNSKILRNYCLKKKANIIEKEVLDIFYPDRLREKIIVIDEIVVPMFELNEKMIRLYLNMHGSDQTCTQINNMISLAGSYNKTLTDPINVNMINTLTSIDTMTHWKNPDNCNFNMDDIFNMRTLSYNGHHLHTIRYATINGAKTLNELLTKLDDNKKKHRITLIENDNYHFNNDDRCTIKSEHMNISHVLRNSKNRTFYATIDEGQFGFTNDQIADIFDRITNDNYRFHLLNSLLVSKEYCHFVVTNGRVLKRNADLFEKYKPIFAYTFGYAWTTMYLEESIFTTKTKKTNRYVTHDGAEYLPQWPFSMENVHNNPYVTLLLNRDLIDPKTNCMSINSLENYKKHYGVCSKEEAFKRFNTFTSQKNGVNIFKGLDPKIFSFSGSIIPACLQRHSPLFDQCTDESMEYDDAHTTYYSHYYADADIDVMCGTKTLAEFFLQTSIFLDTLCKNVECSRQDIKITPNKKMAVIISEYFFRVCVDDLNHETGEKYTSNTLKKLFDECLKDESENVNTLPQNILDYFYVDYVQEKNNSIKKWNIFKQQSKTIGEKIDDELIKAFNVITSQDDMSVKLINYNTTEESMQKKDCEMYYFVNDFMDDAHKVPKEENYLLFKFGESIKFKLNTDKIKRSVEIFMTNPVDPFNTVARFHVPCVRAFFQGDKIYMLPSFITAMMTGINIDYKYFAGTRNPANIINKYLMRGYSVILNTNEKKSIYLYNKNIDEANGMFKIEGGDDNFFGPKDLNNKIFKPLVYSEGLSPDIYKKSKHTYINTVQDLKKHYSKHLKIDMNAAPIDILNYTAISRTGNISPYQQWVVDAFYEFMNSNRKYKS